MRSGWRKDNRRGRNRKTGSRRKDSCAASKVATPRDNYAAAARYVALYAAVCTDEMEGLQLFLIFRPWQPERRGHVKRSGFSSRIFFQR